MTALIQDVYRRFLQRELSLDELRDWLALNQWELSVDDQALADEADVALAHLDDGYGDEEYVRSRLATALRQHTLAGAQGPLQQGRSVRVQHSISRRARGRREAKKPT